MGLLQKSKQNTICMNGVMHRNSDSWLAQLVFKQVIKALANILCRYVVPNDGQGMAFCFEGTFSICLSF